MLEDVEPDEVLIAVPSAPGTMRARVVAACRDRGVPVRTMPTVFELLQTGDRLLRQVRKVEVEDILGREPVRMDLDRVGGYVTGRVVLVTGAGGSIGREVCRQIAASAREARDARPRREQPDQIRRELASTGVSSPPPRCSPTAVTTSGCARFLRHRPEIVFHAAAYKRVPLMEHHPEEAIRNNAVGTRSRPRGRWRAPGTAFVLVSTDKAVRPQSVMGASKRWPSGRSRRQAAIPPNRVLAVRFGNVLGSRGCIVPIFTTGRSNRAARSPSRTGHEAVPRDDPGGGAPS